MFSLFFFIQLEEASCCKRTKWKMSQWMWCGGTEYGMKWKMSQWIRIWWDWIWDEMEDVAMNHGMVGLNMGWNGRCRYESWYGGTEYGMKWKMSLWIMVWWDWIWDEMEDVAMNHGMVGLNMGLNGRRHNESGYGGTEYGMKWKMSLWIMVWWDWIWDEMEDVAMNHGMVGLNMGLNGRRHNESGYGGTEYGMKWKMSLWIMVWWDWIWDEMEDVAMNHGMVGLNMGWNGRCRYESWYGGTEYGIKWKTSQWIRIW